MKIEGKWIGYYQYGEGYILPFFGTKVEIEANFISEDTNFDGTITELPSKFSIPINAQLKGFINEDFISFVKSYSSYPIINEENKVELTEGKLEIPHNGFVDFKNNAMYGGWTIEEEFMNENGEKDFSNLYGTWLLKKE